MRAIAAGPSPNAILSIPVKVPIDRRVTAVVFASVRKNVPLAALTAIAWIIHKVSEYPADYLFKLDREIWFIQLGTLFLFLAESLLLAVMACLLADWIQRIVPEVRPEASSPKSQVTRIAAGIVVSLFPLVACLASGALRGSLYLDEITYWYYERSDSLRALESGRPGSRVAPYFVNFFFCDIQKIFHAIVGALGLTLQRDPELFFRGLSLISFIACVVGLFVLTYRESRSWWWSVAAALAFSACPLFLFYAFDARVFGFSTLTVILYLTLFVTALRSPRRRWLWIAGGLAGIFAVHVQVWVVCLCFALGLAGLIRILCTRRLSEIPVFLSLTLPAGVWTAAEAYYIRYGPQQGGSGFPLFSPASFAFLGARTLKGPFFPWTSSPLPFWELFSVQVLVCLLLSAAYDLSRSREGLFVISAVVSIVISVLIGWQMGFLLVPRYQVPLFGAVFFSLIFIRRTSTRVILGLLVAIEVLLIPSSVAQIKSKANGKAIAEVIQQESPRVRTAVVLQHSLRLGYPDPLHEFVLHFYLDELNPTKPRIHFFELPSLRDVTGEEGVRRYFNGGIALRDLYASIPAEEWRRWLGSCPYDRVWTVLPVPAIQLEREQANAFVESLARSGFRRAGEAGGFFGGYPPTEVWLYVRPETPRRLQP